MSITIGFSIVFVYVVLCAQFESFLHPFTILLTLPLAAVGACGALYAQGMTLNIFSFIGRRMTAMAAPAFERCTVPGVHIPYGTHFHPRADAQRLNLKAANPQI